jgi:hypothetical protein
MPTEADSYERHERIIRALEEGRLVFLASGDGEFLDVAAVPILRKRDQTWECSNCGAHLSPRVFAGSGRSYFPYCGIGHADRQSYCNVPFLVPPTYFKLADTNGNLVVTKEQWRGMGLKKRGKHFRELLASIGVKDVGCVDRHRHAARPDSVRLFGNARTAITGPFAAKKYEQAVFGRA